MRQVIERGMVWNRTTARALGVMAAGCTQVGRLDNARALLAASVDRLRDVPPGDLQRLTALHRLGSALVSLGHSGSAEVRFRQVLSELSDTPSKAPDLLATMHRELAEVAHARGDHEAAETNIRRALEIRDLHQGPVAARAVDEGVLGAILAAQGRKTEARAVLDQALAAIERAHGRNDYEVAVVLRDLAALDQHGDPDRSRALYERSLIIKRRRLGNGHPEVGIVLNELATVCRQQGDHQRAGKLLLEAQMILVRGYGPDHPATRACLGNLRRIDYDSRAEPTTKATPAA